MRQGDSETDSQRNGTLNKTKAITMNGCGNTGTIFLINFLWMQ